MAGLTFRAVGAELGISDRTVVYYFPTKAALATETIQAIGADLELLLGQAFGSEPSVAADLMQRAWPLLTTPTADRIFALYFELVGLASAGRQPFVELTRAIVTGWIHWMTPHVLAENDAQRLREASAIVAQIDGLLLLRHVAGPELASSAADWLAIEQSE